MPFADCLDRHITDPADKAAITAAVQAAITAGDEAAAETVAANHLDAVEKQVADVRRQLGPEFDIREFEAPLPVIPGGADENGATHISELYQDSAQNVTWADVDSNLEGALKRPGWYIITATQDDLGAWDAPVNVEANDALLARLRREGADFRIVDGVYEGNNQGTNFMVLGTEEDGRKLGMELKQDTVITYRGLVGSKTGKARTLTPATGVIIGEAALKEKYYSKFRDDGRAFSLILDFDATHEEAEVRELSQPRATGVPRTIAEAVKAGKPFELIHWSTTGGLKTLDPAFAGTAGAGQEKALYAQGAKGRIWAGLLGRYRREGQLGSHAYRLTVKPGEVYDIYTDPAGFRRKAAEKFPTDPAKRQNYGDELARKAGYKWMYSSKEGPWFPVLYTVGKVTGLEPIEDPSEFIAPAMPKPTAAEAKKYLEQSGIQVVGADELGTTFESRHAFYERQRDTALEAEVRALVDDWAAKQGGDVKYKFKLRRREADIRVPRLRVSNLRKALTAAGFGHRVVDVEGSTDKRILVPLERNLDQRAFHGTGNDAPYAVIEYGKVNSSGGEGTQMEGWGVYVTEERSVAKFYRKANARQKQARFIIDGEPIKSMWTEEARIARQIARAPGGVEEVVQIWEERLAARKEGVAFLENPDRTIFDPEQLARDIKSEKLAVKEAEKSLALAKSFRTRRLNVIMPGTTYEVEVPDDTGSNYLDWNAPLSEQRAIIPKLQAAMDAAIKASGSPTTVDLSSDGNSRVTGDAIYTHIQSFFAMAEDDKAGVAEGPEGWTSVKGREANDRAMKATSDALREAGIVGNKYFGNEGKGPYKNRVIFEDVPVVAFEQPNPASARGRLSITDDAYVIHLLEGADLSTVLHETGHVFLEELLMIARSGAASESTLKLTDSLMKALGNNGEAITVQQHEAFAAMTEDYLMRGEAPSAALRPAFQKYRQWLTRVYERALAGGDPNGQTEAQAGLDRISGFKARVAPEVAQVLDRILIIRTEAGALTIDSEFEVPPAEGDDPVAAAHRVSTAELIQKAREALEERLLTKRQALVTKGLKGWEKAAELAVAADPLYQAINEAQKTPVSIEAVVELVGQGSIDPLRSKHGEALVTAGDGGWDPEAVAARLREKFPALAPKIQDGAAMLRLFRDSVTRETAVKRRVKAAADAMWSSYSAYDAMAETPEYAQLLEKSAQYIRELTGRAPQNSAAVRSKADQLMADLPVKDATQVDRFLQKMARHQRGEKAALLKGDYPKAADLNHQARVALEQARIARKVRDKVEAISDRADRIRRIDKGAGEYQYLANAQALAARYELTDPITFTDRLPIRALMTRSTDETSDGYEPAVDVLSAFPDWLIDEQRAGDYREMTLAELENIDNMQRFLETRGRQMVEEKVLDGKIRIAEAVGEMLIPMGKLPDKKVYEADSITASLMGYVDNFLAMLNIWQFRVRAADGYTSGSASGPNERFMFDPLHQKSNEAAAREDALLKELAEPLAHLNKRVREQGKYVDTGIGTTEAMKKLGRNGWTFENLVVVALNMGNSYNAEACALGLGFVDSEGNPDVTKLHRLTAPLTAADWDAVAAIWKGVDTLWPDLAATFERRMGFPLTRVQADPITVRTSDGAVRSLPGGYYPVKFDPAMSTKTAERAEKEDLANASFAMFPTPGTKSGMTKARTSTGGKPLLLTLGGLQSHLKDTVQYIAFSETVNDLYRMSKHPAYEAAFVQKFGREAYLSIRKMLADIGMPTKTQISKLDSALSGLKSASTTWVLGMNLGTAVKQANSVFNFAAEHGWGAVVSGYKTLIAMGPRAVNDLIAAESPYMRTRQIAADREVADLVKGVSWLANPKLTALRNAMFWPIQAMDNLTTRAAWLGARNKALAAGLDPKAASFQADKDITLTIPGAWRPLDQNTISRDKTGWIRLLSSFSTFTFHFGNRQRYALSAWQAGAMTNRELMYRTVVEGVMAPVLTLALMDFLWGNFPPKDEKAKGEMWWTYLRDTGTYQVVGLPILRELANGATADKAKKFGETIPTFSGLDMTMRAGRAIPAFAADMASEDKRDKALMALADLLSFGTRLPVSKIGERLYEGWRQLDAFPNDEAKLEFLNDAFTLLIPDPEKRNKQ
jgi:hypothetical protein